LFKDPPPLEDCPICFLPIPVQLLSCVSLPPATKFYVPIYDFAKANEELAGKAMDTYFSCCGKRICGGCVYSFDQSGNDVNCPFCNSEGGKTVEERVEDLMKRAEANDAASTSVVANYYYSGLNGIHQDHTKAIDLYVRAAELGCSEAHFNLAGIYYKGEDTKKARFHFEAAAMAGHEVARFKLGILEAMSGNMERAVKHWMIAVSAGDYKAMHHLITSFKKGHISRNAINLTLRAYNNACVEMRSDARDAFIRKYMVNN
jgi:TPR repeat protein